MTAVDLATLDPRAAAYIRTLDPTTPDLAGHGDPDQAATLALVQRAVAAHLAPIAA